MKDSQKNAASTTGSKKAECDQNHFFLCPTDNQCIPRKWLADGEIDCLDGTDESEAVFAALQHTNNPIDSTKKPQHEKIVDRDMIDNQESTLALDSVIATDNKECTPSQQRQAARCSTELLAWIIELRNDYSSATNSSVISIFRSKSNLLKVQNGCELLASYLSCLDGLPATCEQAAKHSGNADGEVNAKEITEWLAIQMYMCEFIVPSVKEHFECFGDKGLSCLSTESFNNFKSVSTVCALVGTTLGNIDCVEQHHSNQCDEAATELFGPIRSESEHVFEELKCTVASSFPINVEEVKNENFHDSTATTKVIETVDLEADNHQNTAAQHVHLARTTTERTPSSTTTTVIPKVVPEILEPKLNFNDFDGTNLSNALMAFANTDLVCSTKRTSNTTDLWAPIRIKICARRNQIDSYKSCFKKAQHATQEECVLQIGKTTTCNAIDTFNKNVDCVINSLNDICPADAQEIVVNIQEKLNDEAIAHKCNQTTTETLSPSPPVHNDGFTLTPVNPRCNAAQENAALVCLVELIEINKQLPGFASVNFLLEISNENSTIMNRICLLYEKYDNCLKKSVFGADGNKCSFNSPINTLARIGLSPICDRSTRQLLKKNRDCLSKMSQDISTSHCQSGLLTLGTTVELMLQGIHGEALLCKTFYLLRQSFECGEDVIRNKCDAQVAKDLDRVKQKMSEIGEEEGCPATKPSDLDAIIARPVLTQSSSTLLPPISPVTVPPPCEADAQKQFNECVQPLTAFQPHPLAVIKSPKEIDNACRVFAEFKVCRANVKCNPLWARGMTAMFEYTCGDGFEKYSKVKTCVRRVTTRNDVRDCVTAFSKSAPQKACQSSNKILACALPHIGEKCGAEAVNFVREYVNRFTVTIDPACVLFNNVIEKQPTIPSLKSISIYNCTAAETATAEQCAQPLVNINAELEALFQGGFQSFLKNVNSLAPIFVKGCALRKEFRKCAQPVLSKSMKNETQCVISSCFLRAGNGICDQPDVSAVIESNLGCVFKQVSDPEFAKCLRSTITTLKQFSLEALRGVLPKFVECIEPIVLGSCGVIPLNVLKAFGSRNVCPVDETDPIIPTIISRPQLQCTAKLAQDYDFCSSVFTSKYDFFPVSLLKYSGEGAISDALCTDFEILSRCIQTNRICEKPGKSTALRKLAARICSNKNAFDQRIVCLNKIFSSKNGAKCLQKYNSAELNTSNFCATLNQTIECAAESVFNDCPTDSVPFVYDYTNGYLRELVAEKTDACELVVPTAALQTGCSESDLIRYLECESVIDKYRFQPISIIKDFSNWKNFCTAVEADYQPCLAALTCKFEPVMSANLALYQRACDSSAEFGRSQSKYANCLNEVFENPQNEACLDKFRGVDMLGRDVGSKICVIINSILNCSAPAIYAKCGPEALTHVYALHQTWLNDYNETCQIKQASVEVLAVETKAFTTPAISKSDVSSKQDNVEVKQTTNSVETSTKPATEEPTPEPELSTSTEKEKEPTTIIETTTEKTNNTITSTLFTNVTAKTMSTEAEVTSESPELLNPKLRNRTIKVNRSHRSEINAFLATVLMLLSATIIISF